MLICRWCPLQSLGTHVWTQYVIIMYFKFFFSAICSFGYARLGTWGWRISLLKVWQLIITLFNASFESLISNCLQEPIHGTPWKRHTKRVALLSFPLFLPFVPDNHTHIWKWRILYLSILSNNMFFVCWCRQSCCGDTKSLFWGWLLHVWARRIHTHTKKKSTHVKQSWQIVKEQHIEDYTAPTLQNVTSVQRETSFRAGIEHKLVFFQAISSTENVGITG